MTADPLTTLREYRQLAPWGVRDLAATCAAILAHAGVRPVNAAAAPAPSERTVRFYVTRGLVASPQGRGTAATYAYRHLLQVLGIKLRQMEGASLDVIAREQAEMTGDVLERRVAAALGPGLPPPGRLRVAGTGRAFHADRATQHDDGKDSASGGFWRRVVLDGDVELLLRDTHPLARSPDREPEIVQAVRAALAHLAARRADTG